jgi:hypothetical protein
MNRRSLFRSGEPGFCYDPPCYSRWYSRGVVVPVRWPKVGYGVGPVQIRSYASTRFRQGLEWPLTRTGACRMQIVHRYQWAGALNARQQADFGGRRRSDGAKRCTNRYAAAHPRVAVKGGSSMNHGQ